MNLYVKIYIYIEKIIFICENINLYRENYILLCENIIYITNNFDTDIAPYLHMFHSWLSCAWPA